MSELDDMRKKKRRRIPTQLERVITFLDWKELPETDRIIELSKILAEAQNEPPDGGADGSITEELWTSLRDYINAARRTNELREVLLSKTDEAVRVRWRRKPSPDTQT